jgi:two-component sensor histidine kinase
MKPSHDIRPTSEEHDNLLLAEERHRTANEIASVLALLRLASRRGMDTVSHIEETIARLEGFERSRRILARSSILGCDVLHELTMLLDAIQLGRPDATPVTLVADAPSLPLRAGLAHTFLIAAYELVTNALKHGATGDAIRVECQIRSRLVMLEVISRASDAIVPQGSGSGLRIVRMLCEKERGLFATRFEGDEHVARIVLRRSPRPDRHVPRWRRRRS